MRDIVKVPLVGRDGSIVGRVWIDKRGNVKIIMKRWVHPSEIGSVLSSVNNFAGYMNSYLGTTSKRKVPDD